MSWEGRYGEGPDRLMSPAFRTFVAMNFEVSWMAMRRSVRSPEAFCPKFCC